MSVMYLGQVAGKTTVSTVMPEGDVVSAWIGDAFKAHFEKVVAEGGDWPPSAVYKTETVCSTWPMGWEKEPSVKYFDTKEELNLYVLDYQEWSRSEDNKVKIKVYEWDLGPTYLTTHQMG